MPRRKRKTKLRPKMPSRVKKRTRKAARPRSLQHPELWGLGLVALGLFLGTVLYAGWNGVSFGLMVALGRDQGGYLGQLLGGAVGIAVGATGSTILGVLLLLVGGLLLS